MSTVNQIAMKGSGFYARMTEGAARMIESEKELFHSLHSKTPSNDSGPYVIADYGAADGGTSLQMITDITKSQRQRSPDRPISVYYTDLPGADFSFMFRMLAGDEGGFPSYITDNDISAFASGISFHQPIFHKEQVDLGFSANAMHWLSEIPPNINGHIHSVGAKGAELHQLREMGIRDWTNILKHRGRELKPGGRMMFLNFALADDGRHLGKNDSDGIFDTLNRIWIQMCEENIVSDAELISTNFAQYYKTISEFKSPFEKDNAQMELNGLVLEECSLQIFPCTYRSKYNASGDATEFASTFVPNVRSWSERTFLNGISLEKTDEERMAIVDELYHRYYNLVLQNPTHHNMDYVYCRTIVKKPE